MSHAPDDVTATAASPNEAASPFKPTIAEHMAAAWQWYKNRLGSSMAPSSREAAAQAFRIELTRDVVPTVLLSFISIFLLVVVQHHLIGEHISNDLVILYVGSFGASTALLCGLPKAPLAQPRNLFVGHFFGAICGLTIAQATRGTVEQPLGNYVAGSLAVGASLFLMMLTNTVHPPGCGTAVIAASVPFSEPLHDRGYWFLFSPIFIGCLILFLVAWLGNNLFPWRRAYPTYW